MGLFGSVVLLPSETYSWVVRSLCWGKDEVKRATRTVLALVSSGQFVLQM
jgi:hypothetical protein